MDKVEKFKELLEFYDLYHNFDMQKQFEEELLRLYKEAINEQETKSL